MAAMMKTVAPVPFGVATTCGGAALGLLPSLIGVVSNILNGSVIGLGEAFIIFLFAACGSASAAFGYFARQGWKEAQQLLDEAQERLQADEARPPVPTPRQIAAAAAARITGNSPSQGGPTVGATA
jgi:hypothetical protein